MAISLCLTKKTESNEPTLACKTKRRFPNGQCTNKPTHIRRRNIGNERRVGVEEKQREIERKIDRQIDR